MLCSSYPLAKLTPCALFQATPLLLRSPPKGEEGGKKLTPCALFQATPLGEGLLRTKKGEEASITPSFARG